MNIQTVREANNYLKQMGVSNTMKVYSKNSSYGKVYELKGIMGMSPNVRECLGEAANQLGVPISLNEMAFISTDKEAKAWLAQYDKKKELELISMERIGCDSIYMLVRVLTRTTNWNQLVQDLNYYVNEVVK